MPPDVRRAWLRLSLLVLVLGAIGATTVVLSPVSRADVARLIEPFGPAAPAAYVVVSALLGMAFVPGPLLAGVSGALFGTGTGFVVTTSSAVLGAVLSAAVSRRAGGPPVTTLSGERTAALVALARRRGLVVVVLQRWVPGVPDAPFSYVFGAIGLALPTVALGTLLGSAPRAFAYTALGDAAVTGDGRLALVAAAVGVVVSVFGALVAGVLVSRRRRNARTRP